MPSSYARLPASYVLEAILSPKARQLVLLTVDDEFGDYVEENVQRLAELMDNPGLYESLNSGKPICDKCGMQKGRKPY